MDRLVKDILEEKAIIAVLNHQGQARISAGVYTGDFPEFNVKVYPDNHEVTYSLRRVPIDSKRAELVYFFQNYSERRAVAIIRKKQ